MSEAGKLRGKVIGLRLDIYTAICNIASVKPLYIAHGARLVAL